MMTFYNSSGLWAHGTFIYLFIRFFFVCLKGGQKLSRRLLKEDYQAVDVWRNSRAFCPPSLIWRTRARTTSAAAWIMSFSVEMSTCACCLFEPDRAPGVHTHKRTTFTRLLLLLLLLCINRFFSISFYLFIYLFVGPKKKKPTEDDDGEKWWRSWWWWWHRARLFIARIYRSSSVFFVQGPRGGKKKTEGRNPNMFLSFCPRASCRDYSIGLFSRRAWFLFVCLFNYVNKYV